MNRWISIGISRFSRQKLLAYVSTIQTSDLIPKQYFLSHIIFLSACIWSWERTNDILFSMYIYSKIILISNVINVATIESMQKSGIRHMVYFLSAWIWSPDVTNDIHFSIPIYSKIIIILNFILALTPDSCNSVKFNDICTTYNHKIYAFYYNVYR